MRLIRKDKVYFSESEPCTTCGNTDGKCGYSDYQLEEVEAARTRVVTCEYAYEFLATYPDQEKVAELSRLYPPGILGYQNIVKEIYKELKKAV